MMSNESTRSLAEFFARIPPYIMGGGYVVAWRNKGAHAAVFEDRDEAVRFARKKSNHCTARVFRFEFEIHSAYRKGRRVEVWV